MYFTKLASLEARLARLEKASSSLIDTYEEKIATLNAQGLSWEDRSKATDFHQEMKELFWKPFGAKIDMQFYHYLLNHTDEYSKMFSTTGEFLLYAKNLKTDHAFLSEYLNNTPSIDLNRFLFSRINNFAPDFFKDEKYMLPFLLSRKGYNAFVIADHGTNKQWITDLRKDKVIMKKFLDHWGKGNVKEKNYLKKNFVHPDAIWSMERDADRRREERRLNLR
jgi:hypothetical protein